MSQSEGQELKPTQSKAAASGGSLTASRLIDAVQALTKQIGAHFGKTLKQIQGSIRSGEASKPVIHSRALPQTQAKSQAETKAQTKRAFRRWFAWALFIPLIILGLWLLWLRQTQERLYQAEIDLVPTTASLVEGWQAQSGEALNLSRGELLQAAVTAYRQQNYPVAVIYLTTLHQTEPVYRDTLLAEAQSYVGLYNRLVELDGKLSGLNPSRRAKLEAAAAESETAGLVAQFGQPTYLLEQALAALERGLRLDPLDRRLLELKDAIINL